MISAVFLSYVDLISFKLEIVYHVVKGVVGLTTDRAVELLMVYVACMLSENCFDCPYKDSCQGWDEEEIKKALHYLSKERIK